MGVPLVHGFRLDHLRGDLYGGLTAAVVALPLALAFGVASGAGPMAGVYGAILVGLFAALLGGTPSQVSGPTGPMTVVMAALLVEFAHQPAIAFTVVVMSGLLQMLFGWLKLGRYITYIPYSVISGFMSGIGLIIILLQLAPLVGHATSEQGVIHALTNLSHQFSQISWQAALLGLLGLGIMLFTPGAIRRYLPSPLLALLICTPVAMALGWQIPTIGEIPQGLPTLHPPHFSLELLPNMIQWAITLALLGSIDSLLTSLVADNFTRTEHNADRELIGQGVGNMVAGLFGAIPGAGATMRTVVNIRAGGRTPISGALHALILLGLMLGLAPLAESIPHAVLAGILIKVGWDIIDWDHLKRLYTAPRAEGVVTLTVLLLTVIADLVTAVGVGIVMVSLISAKQMSEQQLNQLNLFASDGEHTPLAPEHLALLSQAQGRILLLHLSGPFSFCSAKDMVRKMGSIGANYRVVVLDLEEVTMIDTSIALVFEELIQRCQESGREVVLICGGSCSINGVVETLDGLGIMAKLTPANCHPIRKQGLKHALKLADIVSCSEE
uniref:Putative Sulfate transporter n=1 Tax=Magnetococcus massalia (strain MO-1) TaxID=451514 RepID=A0A1S7LEY2_MAGMO|nr:putative Sulfate transporter [Candidatus Magnetococcus massalia]